MSFLESFLVEALESARNYAQTPDFGQTLVVIGLLAFILFGVPIIEAIITVVLYCTIYSTTFWYIVGAIVVGTGLIVLLYDFIDIWKEKNYKKKIN
jgi:hypothetical protein